MRGRGGGHIWQEEQEGSPSASWTVPLPPPPPPARIYPKGLCHLQGCGHRAPDGCWGSPWKDPWLRAHPAHFLAWGPRTLSLAPSTPGLAGPPPGLQSQERVPRPHPAQVLGCPHRAAGQGAGQPGGCGDRHQHVGLGGELSTLLKTHQSELSFQSHSKAFQCQKYFTRNMWKSDCSDLLSLEAE